MFIKQASDLSGATQRAIRLYESLGLIEVARSGKYRVYTETHIKLIKMIKEAQTLGIQLSEIVSLKSGKDDFDWQTVSDILIEKQRVVEQQIKQLQQQKERIKQYRQSIDICIKELDSNL